MKKFFFMAFAAILLASCGTSPTSGIDVVGRWYAYTDETRTEVDSTAYFEFTKDQHYGRRYHNAGSLETCTYACSDNTKAHYGKHKAKRVSLRTYNDDEYFVDIVKDDGDVYMFVITYRENDKENIIYHVKEQKKDEKK